MIDPVTYTISYTTPVIGELWKCLNLSLLERKSILPNPRQDVINVTPGLTM
jgi:hypothetical protein